MIRDIVFIILILLVYFIFQKKESFNNLTLNFNNLEFVLICATGRSGSTTLQQIINTIPNSNICGENGGAINNLQNFIKILNIH